MKKTFVISVLKDSYAVCRLNAFEGIPDWALDSPLSSVTRTSEELSVVCPAGVVPGNIDCEQDWKCLKVQGPLGLSESGIVSGITSSLASAEVSVFVLSTYETDYILVKQMNLAKAAKVLSENGHQVFYD